MEELLKSFLEWLKEESLPGIWSKGVQASRNSKSIERLSNGSNEIKLKMLTPERPLAFEITLWPGEPDAHCNCGSKVEPCHHIVAAAIALSQGNSGEAPSGIHYRWLYTGPQGGKPASLRLQRFLRDGEEEKQPPSSLISWVAGVRSGRLPGPLPSLTSTDLKIDELYASPHPSWPELLQLLADLPPLPVLGHPAETHLAARSAPEPSPLLLREDERGRFHLEPLSEASRETLAGGLWIRPGVVGHGPASSIPSPRVIPDAEIEDFLLRELPRLRETFDVRIETKRFPRIVEREPTLRLRITPLPQGLFSVLATVDYGSPTDPGGGRVFWARNPEAEGRIAREARERYSLILNEPKTLTASGLLEMKRSSPGDLRFPELDSVLGDYLAREAGLTLEAATRDEDILMLLRKKEQNPGDSPRIGALLRSLGEPRPPSGDPGGLELRIPQSVRSTLRDYQQAGCAWLQKKARELGGAILADDMGLGKTIQTLAILDGPALLVVPASLLRNWREEARRFRPDLRVVTYHGPERRLDPEAAVTLTTYSILGMEAGQLSRIAWKMVVLDEAHIIRNPETRAALASAALTAGFRLALTGTPIQNRKRDLFSLFQFVAPGLFPYEESLAPGLISPFFLRRTKSEVLPELPPKTRMEHEIELDPRERQRYESVFQAARSRILASLEEGSGEALSPLGILEVLLRSRQICSHQALIEPGRAGENSTKLSGILELVSELLEAGHSVLLYSQWTGFLDLLEGRMRNIHPVFRLDGSTRNRGDVVESFQSSGTPAVFLLSLQAGGVGLNLVRASHVIFCEPWWNPHVELQAEDRAYRMGQEKPVTIHRFLAKHTIEEGLRALQARKLELGEETLNSGDLRGLLSE